MRSPLDSERLREIEARATSLAWLAPATPPSKDIRLPRRDRITLAGLIGVDVLDLVDEVRRLRVAADKARELVDEYDGPEAPYTDHWKWANVRDVLEAGS